ncbi:MAG: hypothetical protein NVV68_07195 [Dokdonella sp.]|nr:hypothetical protein [Dokdonella sp.]
MRGRWQAPDRPELGFVNGLGRLLHNAELTRPGCLPDLRSGPLLLIGSDYSGQHKTSKYEALSFLIADWSKSNSWIAKQKAIREVLMPDSRRFGFKHMRDGVRRTALPHFLSAAESLTGLLLVVLIHKSVGKLFSANVDIADLDERRRPIATWPPVVLERAMCAATLVSVILSGLSRQGQDVLWITDADDVVANDNRHRQFVDMFSNVSSNVLKINLGHMRIATTASDEGGRCVEDFVAIPDLAAGAICDAMSTYQMAETRPGNRIITPVPETLRDTTRYLLLWWLSQGGL